MAIEPSSASAPRGQSPRLWSTLTSLLALSEGASEVTVLDCGGGSGSLAVPLAAAGARITVVDVSIDALGTLARRAAEAGVSNRVTGVQGDAESLSALVPTASFDLVLAHDVLGNVTDVRAALAEFAAVLRPGGALSVVVANPVAAVLSRALSGDLASSLALLRRPAASALTVEALTEACRACGLDEPMVEGLGVFSELIRGVDLDRPGALSLLTELEDSTATRAPFREIAARLHLVVPKPG